MKIKSMLLGALALVCACTSGEETKELGVNGVSHGAAARKLQTCGFLLNKDFKENAKYYLCLFSASWCGPCRREMPRIAKTYAESLKADPNIELIHFSRDNDENKALAWAKEHDVKFPVVKYNGGNPLDLHSRGIPHLFIVDADGKLLEEGHPAKLFTNEKLNALKAGKLTAPETATEKTRKAIAKLFPGWSLDTEVCDHDFAGIQPLIRGKRNVTFVHPKNRETPSVISRTVKLSGNNPCLSLCVASWNDDADFQLSVRVNGMNALTNRIVCTTDAAPWEDIIVPLSAWRGSTAKIEVVFTAYGRWWCEFPNLARVDIVEADVKEGKCEVDGYTWSYRTQNGEATIVAENEGWFSTVVSPCPVGNLTIPATIAGAKVTHIGRDAFLDCSALTSVTIPEGVSRIGREAFRDCTGLKSIKIPSSVKIIERDAFMGCVALSSVSIPEGVTIIDRGAFIRCYGLESIEIPSSVKQIGRDAFCNCGKLTSVTIPEKVTDIGYGAFHGCNALTSVTIPASVTNINLVAFRNTGALTSFHVAPGNRFYKSENGLLLTKDGTTLVRGVNGDATIPPSVTAIGGCAFEGCVALRSAEIPSGVKSIGPCAFKQCRGMKSVTIPSSVMDIGREAFSNCKGLKSIAIPQGVTVIRNSTFCGSALTEVTIPANVKVLERGAFSWCGELKSVTFPEGMTIIGRDAFYNCGKLTSLIIPSSVQRIEQGAFHGCGSLTSVTMRGERPNAPKNIFERCGNLKSIHVPANAKNWAGMKEWQGIPLVFDGKAEKNSSNSTKASAAKDLTGPYGILMQPDPGCEKGAEYVLKKLVNDYLPVAVRYYGDPFGGKSPSRVFTVKVKRNDGKERKYTGPSWGGRGDGSSQFTIGLARGSDKWDMDLTLIANKILTVCDDDVGFHLYVNDFIRGDVKGDDPVPEVKEMIRRGLAKDGDEKKDRRLWVWRKYAPMWSVFEELRERHPTFILDYCNLKNSRYAEGKLPAQLSQSQMIALLSEVTGENVPELFKKHGIKVIPPRQEGKVSVAKLLQDCDFLLNKDFKKNAKYYLCLFSASWCGPCRREMPRIAKTYVEKLKDDPDIEFIHFSRDQNDEKALAWAKEHDVKFPVVKPMGGNPLDLHSRGIPHLFIVKADGTLVEEGHPMKLFTDEKLRELKVANRSVARATEKTGDAATKLFPSSMGTGLEKSLVGYWPFDGNANDATRYRNNGTLHGVTPAEDRHGKANKAYRFNGSSYIEVPHSETLNMTHAITLTAWIKPHRWWGYNGWAIIMQKGDKRNCNYQFGMAMRDNRVYLCGNDISSRCGQLGLELNKWQQVALTYESGKSLCLYRDGVQIGTWKFGQDLQPNNGRLLIGYDPFGSSEYFIGDMDDVRLFNRSLSEKEIEELYKAEASCPKGIPQVVGGEVSEAFSLNAAPGSVTELDLGNVPPLQFVYCPAGKFSMGYKEQPALSKVKDIEISSPFWVSKTPLRVDQFASLGLNSITDTRIGAAGIDDVSIVIQKLPSVLKERFGKMLPPGYVFRLPTEAEFEYLQKAETKDKNAPTNIWGVERLYSGGIIALLDRAPAYGRGVDVVNDVSNGTVWTVLAKVNYENQPDKDPVGWSDDPNWSVFRRRLTRDCKEGKLIADQRNSNLYGFYFVVAPDVDKLNKFYWK